MNELEMISDEVKEIFNDKDLNISSIIKKLAEEFGSAATLEQIYNIYTSYKLPSRVINGKTYVAGYKGQERIGDGWYSNATLLDVKQSGKSCKLMFGLDGKFIYQTLDEFTLNEVVDYAKDIGKTFKIFVLSETIPATGDLHAVIDKSEKETG